MRLCFFLRASHFLLVGFMLLDLLLKATISLPSLTEGPSQLGGPTLGHAMLLLYSVCLLYDF